MVGIILVVPSTITILLAWLFAHLDIEGAIILPVTLNALGYGAFRFNN